jgi:hypothetical protein
LKWLVAAQASLDVAASSHDLVSQLLYQSLPQWLEGVTRLGGGVLEIQIETMEQQRLGVLDWNLHRAGDPLQSSPQTELTQAAGHDWLRIFDQRHRHLVVADVDGQHRRDRLSLTDPDSARVAAWKGIEHLAVQSDTMQVLGQPA